MLSNVSGVLRLEPDWYWTNIDINIWEAKKSDVVLSRIEIFWYIYIASEYSSLVSNLATFSLDLETFQALLATLFPKS